MQLHLSNSTLFCLRSIKLSDCEVDVIKGEVIGILVVVETLSQRSTMTLS